MSGAMTPCLKRKTQLRSGLVAKWAATRGSGTQPISVVLTGGASRKELPGPSAGNSLGASPPETGGCKRLPGFFGCR